MTTERLEITVSAGVDYQSGEIYLQSSLHPHLIEIIKTKEKLCRDSLIKLGWVPPPPDDPIVDAASALDAETRDYNVKLGLYPVDTGG